VVVKPRGEYTCDSTQVEFVVRAEDGRVWDARDILTKGEGTITQPIDGVWWFCEGEGERFTEDTPNLAAVAGERDALKAKLTLPPMTQGLQEGGIPGTNYAGFHDARIHVRGRYDRLGQVQPRGVPELFSAPAPAMEGSGRPVLAKWVASPNNPLTARVMVNRIWQHHFGEGLVRTPNNFGKLGEAPTHPELLDWLAHEFVASGWSIKAMHRLILRSATYQQQTSGAEAGGGKDLENRLFGRQNRRKLTAEELRDAILVVSGALDRKLGGPSVADLSSPRRTLYITTVRSDRSTYQMLFDGADPTGIAEKRIDSVIAPQALWLMNHPFALGQSKAIAARLEREGPSDAAGRVDWICRQLYGRAAEAEEVKAVVEILLANSKLEWEQICQTLLCANEFIYVD
jgi:hypothetical protein